MTIEVEYELDLWDWQGTTKTLEVDSEDFEGMSDRQIKDEIYRRIFDDGSQSIHFVYPEGDVLSEIREAAVEAEKGAQ